jgi:hypothetical protein
LGSTFDYDLRHRPLAKGVGKEAEIKGKQVGKSTSEHSPKVKTNTQKIGTATTCITVDTCIPIPNSFIFINCFCSDFDFLDYKLEFYKYAFTSSILLTINRMKSATDIGQIKNLNTHNSRRTCFCKLDHHVPLPWLPSLLWTSAD